MIKQHIVVAYLGHCGAQQNRYEVYHGTLRKCKSFIESLPQAQESDFCEHCGGYTGTATVSDICKVEAA